MDRCRESLNWDSVDEDAPISGDHNVVGGGSDVGTLLLTSCARAERREELNSEVSWEKDGRDQFGAPEVVSQDGNGPLSATVLDQDVLAVGGRRNIVLVGHVVKGVDKLALS